MRHMCLGTTGQPLPLLRNAPTPTFAPRKTVNYSFTPVSALHFSATVSMPTGAVLVRETTVEPEELGEADER